MIRIITILFALLVSGVSVPAAIVHPMDTVRNASKDSIHATIITASRNNSLIVHWIDRVEMGMRVSAVGEEDAVKVIQTLPGVSAGMEGTSSYYVRGGDMSGNLITVDGVRLYGSSHLLGLMSSFPETCLGSADFRTGGFSGEDSNLTSSHLKMFTRPVEMLGYAAEVSLSTAMASAYVSVPIVKDRLSFAFSGRWSPLGLEYRVLHGMLGDGLPIPDKLTANVYDVYGKAEWKVSPQSTLKAVYFRCFDSYDFSFSSADRNRMGWSNDLGMIQYSGEFLNKVSVSAHLSANRFDSGTGQGKTLRESFGMVTAELTSSVHELQASALARYSVSKAVILQLGMSHRGAIFNPSSFKTISDNNRMALDNRISSRLTEIHLQAEYSGRSGLEVMGMARYNFYGCDGYRRNLPEFSLKARYTFVRQFGIECTADWVAQFYHTLEGIPTGMSIDMVVPSASWAAPERANQIYAGLFSSVASIDLSLGGFFKRLDNTVMLKGAENIFSGTMTAWRDNLEIGDGKSYGMEFMAAKEEGRFLFNLAYTLSKTQRTYPGFNLGKPIPFKFDRRHVFNATMSWNCVHTQSINLKANLSGTASSGHYETVAAGEFKGHVPDERFYDILDGMFANLPYHTHPNNLQMPAYMRLDLGVDMDIHCRACTHTISVGIYNVTNRHNPYSLFWEPTSREWKQLSILPIMPNFKYSVTFGGTKRK